jgi:hypothetical protein
MALRIAIGMLIALVSVAAGATSPPPLQLPAKELGAERYAYVTKIGQLPEDIRKGLARQLEQRELQMADAGMPFSSGDAVIDPNLPTHRLIVAAVGAKYVVVHFERGGVALTRWIVVFERTTAGLNALWHGVINEVYREPKELEAAIRTGTLWKASTKPAQ